jgi:O-antigen biosynthesis protein WbqP
MPAALNSGSTSRSEPLCFSRRTRVANPQFQRMTKVADRSPAVESAPSCETDQARRAWPRAVEIAGAALLLVMLSPLIVAVALAVRVTSRGNVIHWSDRIGVNNTIFRLPKFRTMRVDTPMVATHQLRDPARFLTPIGRALRTTSLDELPQLFSIIRGDMTFVGPRPALFNQDDLIALRTERGVHRLVPGLTGWAQVNGRDELSIPQKVEFDEFYARNRSVRLDVRILILTVGKVLRRRGVAH